jgi:general nucleoside transport system permease protein
VRVVRRAIALVAIPLLSILLALIVASILIIVSGVIGPKQTFDPSLPLVAYGSLIQGALGTFRGISNTLVAAAPLVLTGLAVGVGFKAGLFNIGATGQLLAGGFAAGLVGVGVAGLPVPVAVTIALLAGCLGGAAMGFLPGFLKAFTGAHEVVTTIMLNAIAQLVFAGLTTDVFRFPEATFARTGEIGNAILPIVFGETIHVGVFVALACVPIVWWLVFRTTLGFELRTIGTNPSAARYAGMSPRALVIIAMSLSGLFAGLAGAIDILKLGYYPAIYGTSIGFDGITVALLGRAHPVGILLSALLLGAMRAGAPLMQVEADIPVEIIDVIQATILIFIAAEIVVRRVFRIKAARATPTELQTVTRSYGEQTAP